MQSAKPDCIAHNGRDRLARHAAPIFRQLFRAAQRQRENCISRIGCTAGRENPWPGDPKIADLVGLAKTVGDRVSGRLALMVPPMRWMVGIGPLFGHTSLAPVALAISKPLSKLALNSATASSLKLWMILPSGMPNSSLSLASSMRLSITGISSAKALSRV